MKNHTHAQRGVLGVRWSTRSPRAGQAEDLHLIDDRPGERTGATVCVDLGAMRYFPSAASAQRAASVRRIVQSWGTEPNSRRMSIL